MYGKIFQLNKGVSKKKMKTKDLRVNYNINAAEVKVIDDTTRVITTMKTKEAISLAKNLGLDLIEVDPNSKPPVCKIMEYGKFKYDRKKREHDQKNHQKKIELKELRIRPTTEEHDIEVKLNHAQKFLGNGDKVKFVMFFTGREVVHKQLSKVTMEDIIKKLENFGKLDSNIKDEGNTLSFILFPNKKHN
jgi:translation initiation factor IF-3